MALTSDARVLVVDDHAKHDGMFARTFPSLDVLGSVRQLEEALEGDPRPDWDVAFVDFQLTGSGDGDDRTGLSALALLREHRPTTRIVCYTQIGESGRKLYLAVAHHWFWVDAVLDKIFDNRHLVDFVERLRAGDNPTHPNLRGWLRDADLVDGLFKDPRYVDVWQAWPRYYGNLDQITKAVQFTHETMRWFKESTKDAVIRFEFAFSGVVVPDDPRFDYKGVYTGFAERNRLFFLAPDLKAVIDSPVRRRVDV